MKQSLGISCTLLTAIALLGGHAGDSLQTEERESAHPFMPEIFQAEDRLQSVVLHWSPFPLNMSDSIVVLKTTTLAGEFVPVARLSVDMSAWVDWSVEKGEYYFYQLQWQEEPGVIRATSSQAPPFGTPLPLPEDLPVLNIAEKADRELNLELFVSDTLATSILVESGSETFEGTLIHDSSGGFTANMMTDQGVQSLIGLESEMDVLKTFLVDPVLFAEADSKARDLVWVRLNNRDLGLYCLAPSSEMPKAEQGNGLRDRFIADIAVANPLFAFSFANEAAGAGIDFQELGVLSMINIYRRLKANSVDDHIAQIVDDFHSALSLFQLGPSARRDYDFSGRRIEAANMEAVVATWLAELSEAAALLGHEAFPRIVEVSIGENGELEWVELMAMGQEAFSISDFVVVQCNGEVLALPDLEMAPGDLYVLRTEGYQDAIQGQDGSACFLSVVRGGAQVAVDSFWVPLGLYPKSLGRDVFGELTLYRDSSPGEFNADLEPTVYVNEYAVLSDQSEVGGSEEFLTEPQEMGGKMVHLELFRPDGALMSFITLRIVVDLDEDKSIPVADWDPSQIYHEVDVHLPQSEDGYHLIALQHFDDVAGWIDDQVVIVTERVGEHWARIPDGGSWQEIGRRTFGESNGTLEMATESSPVPEIFALYQNFPNPFNLMTTIQFDLVEEAVVSLAVINAAGRQVAEFLKEEPLAPGQYSFQWTGESLSSGVYFCVLKAVIEDEPPVVDSRKMIYLK